NFRMPNINAALGLAQLELLPQLVSAKKILASQYELAFRSLDGVRFLSVPGDCEANYWLNCILLDAIDGRDSVLEALNQAGLQCRPLWRPMHLLPMYSQCPSGPLEQTNALYQVAINIPSSADLSPDWTLG
ncbi:MAG: DegT/DnrJ/EryC1/StrS family aminotransferase, partial [bacterium]|nr:DegT/DnrJ/EryC1/StrS family aminotransferase [bacterium]